MLILVILAVGLFVALCALLWSRQKQRSRERFQRSKYHGIPTDDLDEDRFSFQEDGIHLIDGGTIGSKYHDNISASQNSNEDVLIDLGSDSGSDFVLSDHDEEDALSGGNTADIDEVHYNKRNDFRIDNVDDEFDIELSEDDTTGFAGF